MTKGVQNNHGAEIICPTITLQPGLNRLTPEQYRELKAVPVITNYFSVGLLQDAKVTNEELAPPPPPPPVGGETAGEAEQPKLEKSARAK